MISDIARKIVSEAELVPKYSVGSIVKIKGRKAKIVGGAFWGTYGVSNHWIWRFIGKNGKLGPKHHGYGGNWPIVK